MARSHARRCIRKDVVGHSGVELLSSEGQNPQSMTGDFNVWEGLHLANAVAVTSMLTAAAIAKNIEIQCFVPLEAASSSRLRLTTHSVKNRQSNDAYVQNNFALWPGIYSQRQSRLAGLIC